MKLAVFPGTFNPVHLGHLMIADSALVQYKLNQVSFVISPNPPNKPGLKELMAVEKRVKLLEAALENNENFKLDLRETKREGLSYTIDTIEELTVELGLKEKVHLILGLDAFLSLPSWRRAGDLCELCHFLVAPRPGWSPDDIKEVLTHLKLDLSWAPIESPSIAISSSQIRERKRLGQAYRYLLPEKVFELYD